MVFLYKSGTIENSYSLFHIENEDLLFLILELHNSEVSCFEIKEISKNVLLLVLYVFQDINSFKPKKVIT